MNFTSISRKLFTMVYTKLLSLCIMLFASTVLFGQAPPNDNACQATVLTPATTCIYVQGTNLNATNSTGVAVPTCGSYTGGDVWFSATVPAGGAITFDMQGGTMTNGALAVYRGNNCVALTAVVAGCDDNSSSNPNMPKVTVTGLVPGSTVYARVWSVNNASNGTFGICATIPVPAPPNDEICNAIELTPAVTCVYQTFTNESASNTSSVPAPVCAGFLGGDVWFKVIVPAATTALVFDSQEGTMTDGAMAIYTGSACTGTLTQLDCDDNSSVNGNMPSLTVGGLVPGDTVWVRFWENNNDNNGTFGICVTLPPPPPANDDPCNAIELTVDVSCNYQTFSNQDATASLPTIPAPGCANYLGGDVWFKAVVPAEGGVVFDSQTGIMTDGGMAVYSGNCNNLSLLACNDNSSVNGNMPSITLGGLNPGDTLWIRFWENGNNNNGTFGICATIPPPPPSNDEACNAIEITPDISCNYQTFTNQDATGSIGAPDPGCAGYAGGDVWFKVVVPAEGALSFDSQDGVMTDGGMALYNGNACTGTLNLLTCDDDASINGLMPSFTVGGLTPGDTLWVRFWENGNDNNGTFGLCVSIPPPAPTNDDPCSAIELTPDLTCNFQTFTNESATNTLGVDDPGCANYAGSDVWFKVVVPAEGGLIFDSQTGVITDGGMALYTGTCDNLTLLDCNDDGSVNGLMPALSAFGLTPGDTIFVRFWEFGNDNNGTFGICVKIPPPPPANDDPCNSVELPVGATCTYQTFTNESAADSPGVPDPGCANYLGGDVWFKAVVPAGGAIAFDTQDGVMTDGGMAIYSGACDNLNLLACDDNGSANGLMPKLTVGGLTPGDTVWVRVWEFGNDNNGTFGICATIPPPPPTNDDPCNAIVLTPDSVCNFQTFTNENATNTPGVPAPGCASYQGSDVWFSVVVPSGGALIFDSNTGVITDGGMALYSGTCGNLSLIDCDDDASNNGLMPFITAGGLTPGDTIWVRFWEFGGDNNGTFDICVRMPPPGPVNDDPCGAIELSVETTCNYQTFTNESSFGSSGVPAPGCANYQGGDVWFKAVVPADGAITFDTQTGVVTDGGMAVYTGTCNNLTLAGCDDDNGAGLMPKMTIGGLTPGDTVWIRFWENGNNNNGTFGICLTIPPPPPGNDNPCGAISITATDSCNYQTFSNEGSYGTASVPDPGCGNYQGADVWFKVTAPAAGALNINTQGGTIVDAGMAIYKADSCNATMTLLACDDNGSSNPDMPYITATGLTPGSTVWIRVWSNGGVISAGTFGICVTIPPLQPGTFSFSCARDTSFSCGGGDSCFTLEAIIPDIHALTDRYAINPLSSSSGGGCFNPYVAPGSEGPSTDLSIDDRYTDVITLPFAFPFFGTTYNSLLASTNGYVSFDITNAIGFSHWNIINGGTPQNLPSTFYDRALIMGPYHDLDPAYTTSPTQRIKYNVTGTAPHRRWILSFYKVPLFQAGVCDTLIQNTHQIVLYEGTGVVEVFIFDIQNCPTWNQGRAMVGMQDFNRTRAIMAPGRAATDNSWGRIGMNESWRFVPIGGPTLFKRVELFDTSGNFLATGDTSFLDSASLKVNFRNLCALNRLPAGLNTLIIRSTYKKFDDPTSEEVGADTIRIFIPNLKVNFDVTNGQCSSPGSVSIHLLNGVQPLRFSSDSGLTWQSDSVFNNLATGTYYFKVQDGASCSRDTIINISALNGLAASFAVINAACNGGTGTVTISASGTRPIRYSSDGGLNYQYGDSIFILPAGTYNFRVSDTTGCSKDSTITIAQPLVLAAQYADSAVHCNGGSDGTISVVSVSGGTGPFTYSFDNAGYNPDSSLSTFAAGPHTVSIKDANGCIKDTTIIITQPASFLALYAGSAVFCNGGSNGIISVTFVSGGVGPYTYSFDNAGYNADSSLSTFAAGSHTVSIKDVNGCTKDTIITVAQPAPFFALYADSSVHCNGGSNGIISVTSVSGGVGLFTYSFDNAAYGPDSTKSTFAAGPHTVSIKDANGCTKDTTITITQPSQITALYTVHNVKCFGGNDGSIIINASGGTTGYEYSVGGGGYQPSDSFPLAAGTYTVSIRDANGCTKDTSIVIGQPTAITATYAVSNVKCFAANSGSIIITASGGTPGYEYSIDGGNSYQADDSFAVVANTYVVRIRDANGCTKDTTITVTQPEMLAASASAGSTGCNTTAPTGQITVTATGGTPGAGGYLYSNGSSFQSSNTFTGLAQNNFTITVKDANGCTVTTAVTVGVANDLTLQTRQDTTICGPISVVLYTTSNAQTIGWTGSSLSNPSVLSPTASPTAIGTAEYIVTAQTGTCILKDTVNIIVTPAPSVDAGNGVSVIKGLDAHLNAIVSNAASFAWTPATYLNNTNTLTPTSVMPQQTITYTLTATNAEGCSNSDTVTVTVLPYCIKVKNAFSPNGDGVNDNWMVYDQFDCLQNIKVQVFNRYGSRVFESKNYRNDWKGTYGGNNLPDATYYYVIDYILLDGRDYQVRGDVTILR